MRVWRLNIPLNLLLVLLIVHLVTFGDAQKENNQQGNYSVKRMKKSWTLESSENHQTLKGSTLRVLLTACGCNGPACYSLIRKTTLFGAVDSGAGLH